MKSHSYVGDIFVYVYLGTMYADFQKKKSLEKTPKLLIFSGSWPEVESKGSTSSGHLFKIANNLPRKKSKRTKLLKSSEFVLLTSMMLRFLHFCGK